MIVEYINIEYVGKITGCFSGSREQVRNICIELNGNLILYLRISTLRTLFIERITFVSRGMGVCGKELKGGYMLPTDIHRSRNITTHKIYRKMKREVHCPEAPPAVAPTGAFFNCDLYLLAVLTCFHSSCDVSRSRTHYIAQLYDY
jgi:hypothetical protein